MKISVLDENDETPMFDQPVYRGKIRENANGTKVTVITLFEFSVYFNISLGVILTMHLLKKKL